MKVLEHVGTHAPLSKVGNSACWIIFKNRCSYILKHNASNDFSISYVIQYFVFFSNAKNGFPRLLCLLHKSLAKYCPVLLLLK